MRLRIALSILAAVALIPSDALGQAQHGSQTIMGWEDLIARLGGIYPTGAGVVAAEVEATVDNQYGPNQTNEQFIGKTFTEMSGPAGVSSHATTVGKFQFGNQWSIAPGVSEIYLYSATHWLTGGYLRVTSPSTTPPATLPGGIKTINNSWIGSIGSTSSDNIALRRLDFAIERDGVFVTAGVNNGGAGEPLLSYAYNSISVGIRDGTHTVEAVPAGFDGAGRRKPEIVAPESFTSFATPMVNAAAAVLIETARTDPGLAGNPDAERPVALKAVLSAGAVHEDVHDALWSNGAPDTGPLRGSTATPLDLVVGAGTVNINFAHLILTGGEQPGDTAAPLAPNADHVGWAISPISLSSSAWWRFRVYELADEVIIHAAWNRWVRNNFGQWASANIDLHLWRVDKTGTLVSLVGDDGVGAFGGGNVVSNSTVENLEHLHITDLEAGDYVLEARRVDNVTTPGGPWDVAVAWRFPEPPARPEDVNGDGVVGFADVLAVLAGWGGCTGCPEDIDGDGVVGFSDVLAILTAWD